MDWFENKMDWFGNKLPSQFSRKGRLCAVLPSITRDEHFSDLRFQLA